MLPSAIEHYRRQQVITTSGLIEARRAAKRSPLEVAKVVTAYQVAAARDAVDSVPLMLAAQGIPDAPVGPVAISGLVGTASDGRPLESLFAQARSDAQFKLMVVTQLQDVARVAAGIGITSRPNVGGYARMLNPPSCSRCTVLAGKFYKWNAGFQRHPGCDCRHVPSAEAMAGDLTTDPHAYFNGLSEADQAKTFGKANAAAIRDGADMSSVVNASRGTSTTALITSEGTTRRGIAGQRLGNFAKQPGSRYSVSQNPRLTPEAIYQIAPTRTEAISLLRANGYLL